MRLITRRVLNITAAALLTGESGCWVVGQDYYSPDMMGRPGMMQGPGMMGGPGMMHGPGPMMGGMGPGMMSADPVANAEQRLGELGSTVGILPEQEPAWNRYAEAVLGHARSMAAHQEAMASSGTMVPDQRLAWRQEGLAQQQAVTQALQELYSVLTPAQQVRLGGSGMGYPWP